MLQDSQRNETTRKPSYRASFRVPLSESSAREFNGSAGPHLQPHSGKFSIHGAEMDYPTIRFSNPYSGPTGRIASPTETPDIPSNRSTSHQLDERPLPVPSKHYPSSTGVPTPHQDKTIDSYPHTGGSIPGALPVRIDHPDYWRDRLGRNTEHNMQRDPSLRESASAELQTARSTYHETPSSSHADQDVGTTTSASIHREPSPLSGSPPAKKAKTSLTKKTRGGRVPGSRNWSAVETKKALDIFSERLPVGKKELKKCLEVYNVWARRHDFSVRNGYNVKKRIDRILHTEKIQSNLTLHPLIDRAVELDQKIRALPKTKPQEDNINNITVSDPDTSELNDSEKSVDEDDEGEGFREKAAEQDVAQAATQAASDQHETHTRADRSVTRTPVSEMNEGRNIPVSVLGHTDGPFRRESQISEPPPPSSAVQPPRAPRHPVSWPNAPLSRYENPPPPTLYTHPPPPSHHAPYYPAPMNSPSPALFYSTTPHAPHPALDYQPRMSTTVVMSQLAELQSTIRSKDSRIDDLERQVRKEMDRSHAAERARDRMENKLAMVKMMLELSTSLSEGSLTPERCALLLDVLNSSIVDGKDPYAHSSRMERRMSGSVVGPSHAASGAEWRTPSLDRGDTHRAMDQDEYD